MSSYRFEEHPGPSKKDILFSTLVDFYTVPKNLEMMKNVIEGKTVLSLRLLDWLVTNYSKRFPIRYQVCDELYELHSDYKNQLKAYSKKLFDPFCRRERVYPESMTIETTIGQMNFFRWGIKHGILAWACQHVNDIERDMSEKMAQIRQKDNLSVGKQPEKGVKNTQTLWKHSGEIYISFR